MANVTAAQLMAKRAGNIGDVELPGIGTVTVRGLTRRESAELKNREMSLTEMEQVLISTAMVDPKMTKEEVAAWQETGGFAEFEILTERIAQLSGMEVNGAKAAYKSVRG